MSTIQTSPDKGNNFLFNQSLINGAFDVWTRAVTFTFDDDTYGPDRWNLLTETNGSWTVAQDTDVPSALGFKYSAKFSNVTENNQCAIVQIVENVDAMKLDDKTVTLSFYAKTNTTEIANLRAAVLSWSSTADAVTSDVVGTWASDGTNPTWAANWTAENTPSNLSLTSSWQRFTLKATIDTASMANFAVVIWTDDGTIAAADDFFITGVKVNEGIIASSYQPKSYRQELTNCQRYCFGIKTIVGNERIGGLGIASTTTALTTVLTLPVEMRITPTLTATAGDWVVSDTVTGTDITSLSLGGASSKKYVSLSAGVASGLTQWQPYYIQGDGTTDRILILSSEL